MKIGRVVSNLIKGTIGALIFGVAAILLLDHFGVVETVKTYVVMSGSMEPAVRLGSVVVARPQASYRPGHIVSFAPDGNKDQIVTHRVVFRRYIDSIGSQAVPHEIGSQAEPSGVGTQANPSGLGGGPVYLTAGDANESLDRWELTNDQIIGRVLFSVPYLGYLVNFAKQPYGFILLVIVPATIVIYEELKYVLRELLQLIRTAKNKLVSWKFRSPQFSPRNRSINLLPRNEGRYPQAGVVISTVGAVLVLAAFSGAFYADEEPSTGNVFSAAEFFGSAPGDVVINEIMWMGSQGNASDEWIELRNMTDNTLDLSNWVIVNLGSGINNDITIPAGKSISANGFFLVANDLKETSIIDVDPDYQTASVSIQNPGEQLVLNDDFGTTIDVADNDGDDWFAGDDNPEMSMERNDVPGDGTVASNWHTATDQINLDAGRDELATPKAANSSP